MAKHLAAARQKALGHPHNDAEIHLRRAKVRELWGTFTTDALMFQAVNAHMESLGFQPVCMATFRKDKSVVSVELTQVFQDDIQNKAAEASHRLELISHFQWDDYMKAREAGGNVAPLSDALRKTELTRAQLEGRVVQKHEHAGDMSFELRVQEALAVKPEGERKVVPLLKDEGHGELLPAPIKADG